VIKNTVERYRVVVDDGNELGRVIGNVLAITTRTGEKLR
jgi:hypothetical protein